MSQLDERRKGLRANLPASFFFNVRESHEDCTLSNDSVLRRLGLIDAIPYAPPQTDAQIILSRIDQKLSILIGILAENSNAKNYTYHATVLDISEYGLSFGHHLEFPLGAFMELGLQLLDGENSHLDIGGTIIHVQPPPEDKPEFVSIYGVEFTNILSKDQNEIVKCIFAYQREQIRLRREQKN